MPHIEELYLKHLRQQPNYIEGDPHLASLIPPLFEIDPSGFLGLWNDDHLVAFMSCHRLSEQSVRIFREHPITSRAADAYVPGQRQYLLTLAGVDPEVEYEMSGSLARALMKVIDREVHMINILPLQDWGSYLELLGYERIPWADSFSFSGIPYYAYQMDLRKEEWIAKITRQMDHRLTLDEAARLVQRALKHYSRLPLHPELAAPLCALLVQDRSLHETGEMEAGLLLQDAITSVLQRWSAGTREEQRFYRILHYAYIHKVGTHEIVAESLNIPVPSYYRYLKSAVRKLAFELMRAAALR